MLPSAWTFYRPYDDTNLKVALSATEVLVKAYTILVREGVDILRIHCEEDPMFAKQPGTKTISTKLDVNNVADEAAARAVVDSAFPPLLAPTVKNARMSLGIPEPREQSSERILARIEATNFAGWVTYLILVSLGGVAILVLREPGFGTWLDFVYCVFWGFGLPTTLDKLQQITPSGVASTIAVSLPK